MDLLTLCNDTLGFKMHAKELCASNIGTIHLRRQHLLGGRGQELAKFANE